MLGGLVAYPVEAAAGGPPEVDNSYPIPRAGRLVSLAVNPSQNNLDGIAVFQEGLIRLKGGRGKTGVKQIAPVTPALRSILAELRAEQQRVRSIENRVFTKEGRLIKRSQLRKAFDRAVRDAGIEDFVFHDFRHMAKTKWAEMGIPVEASMLAAGQTSLAMHTRYVNLQEAHLKEAFKMLTTCSHENSKESCNTITA